MAGHHKQRLDTARVHSFSIKANSVLLWHGEPKEGARVGGEVSRRAVVLQMPPKAAVLIGLYTAGPLHAAKHPNQPLLCLCLLYPWRCPRRPRMIKLSQLLYKSTATVFLKDLRV